MAESVQVIPHYVEAAPALPLDLRPTAKEWTRHSFLFLLTAVTTTIAGIVLAAPENVQPDIPEPSTLAGWILFVPQYYLQAVRGLINFALINPNILIQGITFSGTLLTILLAHEMGHYIACRRYGVSATPPFFIPAPPLFLAGTFGAFIKIRTPIQTRRALFDIGLAGPLAGFIALLPIAMIGVVNMGPPQAATGKEIFLNDPLLFRLLGRLVGVHLDRYSPTNPCYMAAWIGLLVTSLNLMPVGQLDGGHGVFALFGARAHRLIGRLAFATIGVLAILGFWWHGSPSGFLYFVLLAIMLRVGHPQPLEMETLGNLRVVIAILTLIIFCLSFYPFPFTLTYD